jgi:hypothetical protein
MSQTLNPNHNPIVYTCNNYEKMHFLNNFKKNSNLICYNTRKILNYHKYLVGLGGLGY